MSNDINNSNTIMKYAWNVI